MWQLEQLVKDNNFNAIKEIVAQLKKTEDSRNWHISNERYVEAAAREAILLGQIETLQFFLDEGLPIDAYAYAKVNSKFIAPLIYFAAASGNLPIIQLLVEAGAEISSRHSYDSKAGNIAIRTAVMNGHTDIAAYLLEKGATANDVCENRSYGSTTFLAKAAKKGNIPLVKLLLNHGASIRMALEQSHEKFSHYYGRYVAALERGIYKREFLSRHSETGSYSETQEELNLIQRFETKRDKLKTTYRRMVEILLDFAMGVDFPQEVKSQFSRKEYGGLSFLKGFNISSLNFIGISINGRPIDRGMLCERGFEGADKALVSINDLVNLSNVTRKEELTSQLEHHFQRKGRLSSVAGIVNLVPPKSAAEMGDPQVVKIRLKASVNPDKRKAIGLAAKADLAPQESLSENAQLQKFKKAKIKSRKGKEKEEGECCVSKHAPDTSKLMPISDRTFPKTSSSVVTFFNIKGCEQMVETREADACSSNAEEVQTKDKELVGTLFSSSP